MNTFYTVCMFCTEGSRFRALKISVWLGVDMIGD